MTGASSGDASLSYAAGLPTAAEYMALFETTGWNAMYRIDRAAAERALGASWRAVTARSGERMVGMGRLVSDGVLYAVVFDLIVAPDWQGMGIGTHLLGQLIKAAEEAGVRDLLLFAARGTEPFYRRAGFEPRGADAPGMLRRRPVSEGGT